MNDQKIRELAAKWYDAEMPFTSTQNAIREAISLTRNEVIEEVITAMKLEYVEAEETQEDSDFAYNQAINDCINSIRALAVKP